MKTDKNSIWGCPIYFEKDFKIPDESGWNYDNYTCKHLKDNKLKMVAIGYCEGGCDSFGMCAECLLEIINKEM